MSISMLCLVKIGCVSTMILGLNLGGNELPWTHPLVLTMLPLAALFFILFLVVEGKFAKQPILPLYLLSNRTPLVAALVFSFVFRANASQIGSRRWLLLPPFIIFPYFIKSF